MADAIAVRFLEPEEEAWPAQVAHLRGLLQARDLGALFPTHYLQTILPKIGGHIVLFELGNHPVAAGILFPRSYADGRFAYTLRYHTLDPQAGVAPGHLSEQVGRALGDVQVALYEPHAPHRFSPTSHRAGSFDLGRPSAAEANAIRTLYQRIWGSPDDELYPSDIHSDEFGLGTSLVARAEDGQPAGFLFGFYRFGGPALPADWDKRHGGAFRLESQVMGVAPEHRGRYLSYLMKQLQAELAQREGIGVIHWTADPLQYPNAALNFSRLRAIACDFFPNHYTFTNELNRVPASRLNLTWLVGTRRVSRALESAEHSMILNLGAQTEIERVNQGWEQATFTAGSPGIAIEIPPDWTALQRDDQAAALRWRQTTDRLFRHYIGTRPGQYIVTDAAVDGERRYLVAEQVAAAVVERLGC